MPVPLIDPFGRRVKDLRISITDRCNFRCTYCMPEEGMDWLDRDRAAHLRGEARIARVCVERFGFEAIRITGGEPLVRAHLPRLVEHARARSASTSRMTTNGVKLPELAHDLAARRAAAGQRLARHAATARRSSRSPAATSSTGCSPASTPRSTPGSTR